MKFFLYPPIANMKYKYYLCTEISKTSRPITELYDLFIIMFYDYFLTLK